MLLLAYCYDRCFYYRFHYIILRNITITIIPVIVVTIAIISMNNTFAITTELKLEI